MPRACTVCAHKEREAIDSALVAGEPNRRIAARFGVSEQAVRRHAAAHLPERLLQAQGAAELLAADKLLAQLSELQAKARALLGKAEKRGDLRAALAGVREARSCIETAVKVLEVTELERRVSALEEGGEQP